MKIQRAFCAALLLWIIGIASASAQSMPAVILSGGCGTGKANTGSLSYLTVDTTLKLCVNASVSASITGFPGTTQTTGTPLAVTTTSGTTPGTLPAGAVVVVSNVGATNGAYCKLGASASTSDQLIPPNSWFGFTVGTNTQITCITSTSTTTVNMVGGSGLPTGSGGGGGGGSGGAVTLASGAVASGAYASGAFAIGSGTDGWNATEGVTSDAAVAAGAAGTFSAKFRLMTTQLGNISTNSGTQATAANQTTGNTSLASILTAVQGPIPLNVNTTATAQTGLTPGATATSQTGTIIAANVDLSSQAGVAMGVPAAYGTAPTGRAFSANAFVTNLGAAKAANIPAVPGDISTVIQQVPCAPYHLSGGTTASTNSTNIKASAGQLCKFTLINTQASTLGYLKVYDSATAPTCSSATNLKHVYPILAGPGGVQPFDGMGENYANGIAFCVTGAGTDTDNSNAPTGIYVEASFK